MLGRALHCSKKKTNYEDMLSLLKERSLDRSSRIKFEIKFKEQFCTQFQRIIIEEMDKKTDVNLKSFQPYMYCYSNIIDQLQSSESVNNEILTRIIDLAKVQADTTFFGFLKVIDANFKKLQNFEASMPSLGQWLTNQINKWDQKYRDSFKMYCDQNPE